MNNLFTKKAEPVNCLGAILTKNVLSLTTKLIKVLNNNLNLVLHFKGDTLTKQKIKTSALCDS
jgi:hypothetical protein